MTAILIQSTSEKGQPNGYAGLDADGLVALEDLPAGIGSHLVNVKLQFGAIADGTSHPLSEKFTTLLMAQVMYPHATSLAQEIDWAAIQGAIDWCAAHRVDNQLGGSTFLPDGTYVTSDEIVYPTDVGVSIYGASREATTIQPASDFGAGKWAMRGDALQAARRITIQGISFRGTGFGHQVLGERPCNMSGVRLESNVLGRELIASFFNAGIDLSADHGRLENCNAGGNYYGLYFGLEVNAEADQTIIGCDFTGNMFSSIGIRGSNVMGGVTMISTHLGYGPFCIWKESPTTGISSPYVGNDGSVAGCMLIDVAFEGYGNAAIANEDGTATGAGQVIANTFINCSTSSPFTAGYQLPGYRKDAAIIATNFNYNTVLGSSNVFTAPGTACVIAAAAARGNNIEWHGGFSMEAGKTFLSDTCGTDPELRNTIYDHYGKRGHTVKLTNAAVTEADLLEMGDSNELCRRFTAGGTHAPLGVAAHSGSANQNVIMWTDGPVKVKASGDIGGGWYLKPDPSAAGAVVSASSFSDGPIIGYGHRGPSGGTVLATLQL